MLTFSIIDSNLALIPTPYKGMKARIFCKIEEHLPQVKAIGDVVLLRRAKVSLSLLHVRYWKDGLSSSTTFLCLTSS